MKCMFQDCLSDATKIIPCKMGMTGEDIDIHVCKVHNDLLFNQVKVSMELYKAKQWTCSTEDKRRINEIR